jgi:phage gp29-like protein
VWFKKNGIKFWLVFLEKFGMPTAVGKYPPGAAKDQQQALLDAIDAIQNETGIKIPNNMEIDLLEAARSGKVTYETLCEYMDKQISKAVLGQTATTEGTPGKLGNETAQQEVRADILKADADLFCECVNQSLVRWIVDYNFAGVDRYPTLWIRTVEEGDLAPLAERDRILAKDIGLPVARKYFYETYAIPEPEEGEDLVNPPRQQGPEGPAPFAEKGRFTDDQQAVEDLVDGILKEAGDASDDIAAAVKAAVEKAESYEDLHILLAEALGNTEASDKLDDMIARAMLAGEMWGRYAAR